uniref:PRA1 family protein n=1 Tax=Macrostomum lignano TaxID=282301 RepID=A0A1I8J111_9PLAT
VEESSGLSADCAAAYRLYYLKITEVVSRLDSLLRHYVGITLIFVLFAVMLILNALLDFNTMSLLAAVVMMFWFVAGLFILGMVVFVCGHILNLAKKPLEILHRLEITSKNDKEVSSWAIIGMSWMRLNAVLF